MRHELYCPPGWRLMPLRGDDEIARWSLLREKLICVRVPGVGEREMRFSPGDITLYRDRWMGHSNDFGDRSAEVATCREAVEWLLRDHELAVQAIRDQQFGAKISRPLRRSAQLEMFAGEVLA